MCPPCACWVFTPLSPVCADWLNRGGACKHLCTLHISILTSVDHGQIQHLFYFPPNEPDAHGVLEWNKTPYWLGRFEIVRARPVDDWSSGGRGWFNDELALWLETVTFPLEWMPRRSHFCFFRTSAGTSGVTTWTSATFHVGMDGPIDTDHCPIHPNHLQWYPCSQQPWHHSCAIWLIC